MPEPIEKVFVSIGADIADLLRDTKKGVDRIEKELGTMEKKGKRAFKETGKAAKGLNATFAKLQKAATAFIAIFAVGKIAGFFGRIISDSVKLTKIQIAAEKQLETVLRSTGMAAGLTAEEIKEMASQLQSVTNFGDEAIISGQNLLLTFTKIGRDVFPRATKVMLDVSQAMGQDLKTSAIQLGKALNDPIKGLANLQRVGIQFTEQQKDQIETLVEAGRVAEAQGIILTELERQFGGSAEAAREADGGFIAFKNTLGDLQELLGKPILETFTDQFGRLDDILSDEQAVEALQNLVTTAGELAAQATSLVASGIFDSLEDIDPETVENLANALQDAAAAISEFLDQDVSADINGLIEALTLLVDTTTSIVNVFNRAKSILEPIGPIVSVLRDVFLRMIAPITGLIDAFQQLNNIVEQITGRRLVDFSRDVAEASETETQAADRLNESLKELDQVRRSQSAATREQATASDEAAESLEDEDDATRDRLSGLSTEFIDLQAETNAELEANQEDHAEAMAEIDQAEADARADIAEKRTKALADLERNTAREREQIIADAKEELARLEKETEADLADESQDFDIEERRRLEDHLARMRQIRMRFIETLEDAVKNRDARAIVDARRRFGQEQQQEETKFTTDRERRGGDFNLRLEEIRENERQAADEITNARAQDLANLTQNEADKRAEIERNFQEESARVGERFAEQREKELEQFQERQTELQDALKTRLEAVAKELADEEDINREGAEAILSALNETFGIDGDIDALMEDFAKRRRQKFRVEVAFEEVLSGFPGAGTPSPSAGGGGGPAGGGGGIAPGIVPLRFQEGGSVIARRPTLAQFGEVPELATFIPLAKLQMEQSASSKQTKRVEVDLNVRGSAPPGIRSGDRDQIARTMVQALREAGVMRD